jgi:hypothetical protein
MVRHYEVAKLPSCCLSAAAYSIEILYYQLALATLFGYRRASQKLFLERNLPSKSDVFVAYNTILV